jgi:hypothetical protein
MAAAEAAMGSKPSRQFADCRKCFFSSAPLLFDFTI